MTKTSAFTRVYNLTSYDSAKIGTSEFYVARSSAQRAAGLAGLHSLDKDGMVFVYDSATSTPFTMEKMKFDLNVAFYDASGKMLKSGTFSAGYSGPIFCRGYSYVVETKRDIPSPASFDTALVGSPMSTSTNATSEDYFELLARFRALSLYYQEIHWTVRGDLFFQDHLLAERLYGEVAEAIDSIAEKGIAVTGDRTIVEVLPQTKRVIEILSAYPHGGALFSEALKFENELYSFLDELFQRVQSAGSNDFFGQLADEGLQRCYLLMGRDNIEVEYDEIPSALAKVETFTPPAGVRNAAARALVWIADGKAGDGFTATGKYRANQLANGEAVSADVIGRMVSFFARHEVDGKAEGFNSGENGYPSPGRVAWDAWGGDAGRTWSSSVMNGIKKNMPEAADSIVDMKNLPVVTYCPNCGEMVPNDSPECSNCGTTVKPMSTARAPYNTEQRKQAAKTGAALPDGSFPILNESDLHDAIRLAGLGKNPAVARVHIQKRAKALGLENLIPATWNMK